MAVGATTLWRIRVGGDSANGGGYDSAISGAGTDYTDQDSAQLSLSDLACVDSTTLLSVTGGFTSAMIGNCIRISAGTNFIPGYYFITARTDTNTVTLDRKPVTNSTTGASGVGKLGGAFASIVNVSAVGSLSAPPIASPLVAGNRIYIRGAGSDDPSSTDYDYSAGYYGASVSGDATSGPVRVIGYNGKPLILTSGILWNAPTLWTLENIKFKFASGAAYATYGMFANNSHCEMKNCIVDANGQDVIGSGCDRVTECLFYNTGSTSSGSNPAIKPTTYGSHISGNRVVQWRGGGIKLATGMCSIDNNIVHLCGGNGVTITADLAYFSLVSNNVFHDNGGHGISFSGFSGALRCSVRNNIITNNDGYGISVSTASLALIGNLPTFADYNVFGADDAANSSGTTTANVPAGPHDITIDPLYVDADNGDFTPQEPTLEGVAFPVLLP